MWFFLPLLQCVSVRIPQFSAVSLPFSVGTTNEDYWQFFSHLSVLITLLLFCHTKNSISEDPLASITTLTSHRGDLALKAESIHWFAGNTEQSFPYTHLHPSQHQFLGEHLLNSPPIPVSTAIILTLRRTKQKFKHSAIQGTSPTSYNLWRRGDILWVPVSPWPPCIQYSLEFSKSEDSQLLGTHWTAFFLVT